MATSDFKRLGLVFLLLMTLLALSQASRDISELGEIVTSGNSNVYFSGCVPRKCDIGKCWCCVYEKDMYQGCATEKDGCISRCHKPPQRA
ncbi:hypothetical protein MKW98_003833 [Papaver atlanticum]|uniref:Uncharacterized protein n=1 Tax=Papaver atlanticum TaxID=357466 RepID=A0AAD4SW93_9MAGN|nr:hypothetical protein MKW98_003833 [Papaver atlanticum]